MHSNENGNGGYKGPERRKAAFTMSGISHSNGNGGSGPYCSLEKGIFDTIKQPLVILDENLKVLLANKGFYDFFGVGADEILGRYFYDLADRKWNVPSLRRWLKEVFDRDAAFDEFEVEHIFPGIGYKIMLLNARRIYQEGVRSRRVLLSIEDITDRKIMARELAESEELRLVASEAARDRSLLLEKLAETTPAAHKSATPDFGKCKKLMRWNGIYTVFSFVITATGLLLAAIVGAIITGRLERIVKPLSEIFETLSGYTK